MREPTLLERIGQKGVDKANIAKRVASVPELIPKVLEGLGAKKAGVKYGCAKVLRIISEQQPKALYPYIDSFIDLLDSDNKIMNWEGIHVIGNLAGVDEENRIDRILDKYLAPISGPVMITAANAIGGAAKIASAKPHLAERVATEMLKVEHAEYQTTECRNVALGQAITSFDQFFEHIENKEPVLESVRRQLDNTRNSTRKKAAEFLARRQC